MAGYEIIRDVKTLNPKFARKVETLHQTLTRSYQAGETEVRFQIFETFRHPFRQIQLIAEKTTKAGPWQSAHQYGLAADFVPYLDPVKRTEAEVRLWMAFRKKTTINPGEGGWYWPEATDPCWKVLRNKCAIIGVQNTITWDRPHVQDPRFDEMKKYFF